MNQKHPVSLGPLKPSAGSNGDLKSFVDRLETLDDERQDRVDDMKEVFSEAKSAGFDVKTVKRVLKERKKDPNLRRTEEEMLRDYLKQLGME